MADKSRKRRKPFRKRVEFWLSLDNEHDLEIYQLVNRLKSNRKFASSIRRALQLINAIDAGNVAWVEEHYPWLARESATVPLDDLLAELRALQAQLQMSGNTLSISAPVPIPKLDMPNDLSLGALTLNAKDDDTVNVTQNYLDQVFNF